MRLDRFLSLRFAEISRSAFARAIRRGEVRRARGASLRPSTPVVPGWTLHLLLPELAPSGPPPPCPPVLYEDARVLVLDKPAGLACHPGGTRFAWAVVGLARARWGPETDLVHRLDRDTSGVLVLTKNPGDNGRLKQAFKDGHVRKEYVAYARGRLELDDERVTAPIGRGDGPIRIQMAVRSDGLPSRTDLHVEDFTSGPPAMTRIRCVLHTGRTHQIRVHLAHVGTGIVGDRMYGVPPTIFLDYWEHGLDDSIVRRAGAPRQALHAHRTRFPHPDGRIIEVVSEVPADMKRWWEHPERLPMDRGPDPPG